MEEDCKFVAGAIIMLSGIVFTCIGTFVLLWDLLDYVSFGQVDQYVWTKIGLTIYSAMLWVEGVRLKNST